MIDSMQIGYFGIVVLMIAAPIPPEVFMPLAGIMVARGQLNFFGVVLTGVVSFVLSVLPWYWAGRYLGQDKLLDWLQGHRWIKLPEKKIEKARRWFQKYGWQALLFSFLIPEGRTVMAVPAGTSRMSFTLYLTCITLGAAVWLSLLTLAGYVFGYRFYRLVEEHIDVISTIAIATVVIIAIVWVIRWYLKHRRKNS